MASVRLFILCWARLTLFFVQNPNIFRSIQSMACCFVLSIFGRPSTVGFLSTCDICVLARSLVPAIWSTSKGIVHNDHFPGPHALHEKTRRAKQVWSYDGHHREGQSTFFSGGMVGWKAGLMRGHDHMRDTTLATGGYKACLHPSIILMCGAPRYSKVFTITIYYPFFGGVFFSSWWQEWSFATLEDMILLLASFIFGGFLTLMFCRHRSLLLTKILVFFIVPGVLPSWQKRNYCRCISRSLWDSG